MQDGDLARRLLRLKARPTMAGKPDNYLIEMLAEAVDHFRDYTHSCDPGEIVDGLIVELAVYRINMLGAEGATVASEGDISRRYAEDMPKALRDRMNRYRYIQGLV